MAKKIDFPENRSPVNRIDVLGHTYVITFISTMSEEEMGRCHTTTQNIFIRDDLPATLAKSVVLHEVLHAVHWLSDLDDASSEEAFTSRVATNLRVVMLANTSLRDWLFS